MKSKFVDYYMKIAEITAELSYARRLQVGAVIVKENQILATGYNGMPSGWDNNCEYEDVIYNSYGSPMLDIPENRELVTKPEVLHAESNALAKVAKSTESSDGATLFCTHAPCMECSKLIYQSGISNVYYKNQYRDSRGLDFLAASGVNVKQHKIQ